MSRQKPLPEICQNCATRSLTPPPGQAAEQGVGAYLPLLTCREDSGGAPRPGKECTTLIVVTHEQAQVELVLDLNDQVV